MLGVLDCIRPVQSEDEGELKSIGQPRPCISIGQGEMGVQHLRLGLPFH
jgi:hypothetical protein